jgi:hypothetical protein
VTVALGEIVAYVREGLLAMAVGTGLQVMAAMMDADVAAVCGPKGKHDPNRSAVRHTENQRRAGHPPSGTDSATSTITGSVCSCTAASTGALS